LTLLAEIPDHPPRMAAHGTLPQFSHRFLNIADRLAAPVDAAAALRVQVTNPSATRRRLHRRVLLIQAGSIVGIGLVHIAAFLRRHGIEAYVAAYRSEDHAAWARQVSDLIDVIKPSMVGIGFKWYNEVIGALWLAETIKKKDPDIVTVMGGNTAATYFRELLSFGHVDFVVRGDGELPILRLCQGDEPPNAAYAHEGSIHLAPITYAQRGGEEEEIYISHIESMSPRKCDLMSLPNFIVGGKGCAQACLYCSGGRDKQRELFGRKGPFLRRPPDVRRDVLALHPYVGGFFFDFSSEHDKRVSLVDWFKEVFDDLDCSGHLLHFLPWELPNDLVLEYLTTKFRYVRVGLDIGTLSERQRNYLSSHGYFKRYLVKKNISNADFLAWSDRHRDVANLTLALTAISGMPFLELEDLSEEKAFAAEILQRDWLTLHYEGHRLHFEPGSPVVENPALFGMESPINSFYELLQWFESGKGANDPVMRFRSKELETRVEEHSRDMARMAAGRTEPMFRQYVPPENGDDAASRWARLSALHLKRERCREFAFEAGQWCTPTESPRHHGETVHYVKNLLNGGTLIDRAMFGGGSQPAASYGDMGCRILRMFEVTQPVSDVVGRCVATMPLQSDEVYAFIRSAMRSLLLHRAM
jgi:hypothetical protein